MIIGVDAGAIAVTDPRLRVGVYHVTEHLLRELSILDTNNLYRLYSFAPISVDIMKSFGPNMNNIVLRPSSGYMKLWLPLELIRHPIDVFLGLSQALPKTSAHTIGFVYDLGFTHDPSKYDRSSTRLQNQTESLILSSSHIITISESSQEDIISTYPSVEHKISYAYPGVDTLYIHKGKKYQKDRPYFLFVGSLKKSKNIPLLLESFHDFIQSGYTDYDLYLVGGDYWMDHEIVSKINQLHLKQFVRIVGYVNETLLPSYYRGATAFVTASQWEGFCLPAAESLACGTPVICVGSGALPEVVADAGLYIETFDHHTFADMMRRFVTNISLQKSLRARALKQSKIYSWKTFTSRVYQKIHQFRS